MAKKRKLPAILKAWGECRREAGFTGKKAFKKMSPQQKRAAQKCVDAKMAKKK
jgi:hypothetical protein